MKEQILKQHGQWVFIAPISGLRLTSAVNKEFRVIRVTFVDRVKLPRIGKRMGIPFNVSETKKHITESGSFDAAEAQTFAVYRHTGTPENLTNICLQAIKDELDILSLSQLGYSRRRINAHPSLRGNQNKGKVSHLFLNSENPSRLYSNKLTGKFLELVLDERWKRYQRDGFFLKLLKVLNSQISVSNAWRKDLQRASILIGQSQWSTDIAQSFMWNMIALELLLTEQGDKYLEVLPSRVEAFIGWVGYWHRESYPEHIQDVYRKRSQFVHDGKRDKITIEDLLFTDDLLLNILINIVKHIKIFQSKEETIKFGEKVKAEHLLGIKPRVRPKTMQFVVRSYSDRDFEEI